MDTPPPIRVVTDNPEERSMAALAHASILLNVFFPGLGVIAAAAIWFTQREKSHFVGRQGMQATIFQGLLLLLTVLTGVAASAAIAVAVITERVDGGAFFLVPIVLMGLLFLGLILLLGLLYGLVGAYETSQGRDFRYWLIGDMVAKRQ